MAGTNKLSNNRRVSSPRRRLAKSAAFGISPQPMLAKRLTMPCYFFSGNRYIRVTRGQTGPGVVDLGYPASISIWGWGSFGANGIDAALYSGPKDYFFSGNRYIRVTRGNTGPGTVDPGYPAPISNWGWGSFGANGIHAALYSGSKCYFFKGNQYIRVTRGTTGPGRSIRGIRHRFRIGAGVLLGPAGSTRHFIAGRRTTSLKGINTFA